MGELDRLVFVFSEMLTAVSSASSEPRSSLTQFQQEMAEVVVPLMEAARDLVVEVRSVLADHEVRLAALEAL